MRNNSCQSASDQASFLWCLLYLYFVKHSLDEVIQLVSSMYEQEFDFSTELEKLLLKLWETSDSGYIVELAKEAVKQKLFDVEKHIFTVAVLVKYGQMSVVDAAQLLIIDAPHDYAQIDSRIKRVIDVAWLVNEDSKDGVMSPNHDCILVDALKDVTTLFRDIPRRV